MKQRLFYETHISYELRVSGPAAEPLYAPCVRERGEGG